MCRLSCSKACGILVPQPGLEPTSPALQGKFLITRLPGKPPPAHFWIWLSCCCLLEVFYILWVLVHHQTNDLQIFSPILQAVSLLYRWCLLMHKKISVPEVQSVYIFLLLPMFFGGISKKLLPYSVSWGFSPMFPSKNYLVLGLLFRSFIHFELIFTHGIR